MSRTLVYPRSLLWAHSLSWLNLNDVTLRQGGVWHEPKFVRGSQGGMQGDMMESSAVGR